MSLRNGKKFIGAYISADTKKKLQRIAAAEDRPLAYIIQKILSQGVIHPKPEAKAAQPI